MLSTYLRYGAVAASILGFAAGQTSIPKDLSSAFKESGVELQVSFTDNAVEGFKDGTSFSKDEVAKEPTFALGDSSGISTTTLFTVMMVDTTSDDSRTLHYVRSNFKSSGIVNIETKDSPILSYKAPGAFGETGDDRKYTFLMYRNPNRAMLKTLKMPEDGKTLDIKKFQTDNGLSDPVAGMGMVVKLGGGSGGSGQASASPSASASSSAAAAPETSSAAASVSSAVSTTSAAATSAASSAVSSAASSAVASASSARSTTTAVSRSTPAASAGSSASSSAAGTPKSGTTAASASPTGIATASSTIASSVVPVPTEDAPGGTGALAGGSETSNAPLSVQTDSAASLITFGKIQCAVAAALFMARSLAV
ncbi:hypothetical protein P280DRAFT_510413 [Massarina eburnea CBS 473.64]|uniref:Uncharacterized protein n=1 Tax=Massarina eburnea CBS 473.64 TaxID=1395130 RepID=A0A6A6RPE7_9PLEO|nr:hypothetical protein P280DRAFT_510413 [Massarina eburnea CBS 473.64]